MIFSSSDVNTTWRHHAPRIFILALFGGILSTLCDLNHVYTGALSYTYPACFNQAWWVFPNFVGAFFIMFSGFHLFARVWFKSSPAESLSSGSRNLFVNHMIMFVLFYLMTGFANQNPILLSLILYLSFLLRLWVTYERRFIFVAAIGMALAGMAFEGTFSALGQMQYSHPFIYHVPLWLGGLYMHGAFCLRESFRYLVYSKLR